MNCSKCGNPLISGNNICPNCGTLNEIAQSEEDTSIVDLDDEVVNITSDMAPPELLSKNENLTEGIKDISSSDVSTYEEEEKVEELEEEEKQVSKEEQVDIAIPSVSSPIQDVNIPTDGSAPVVDDTATIGEVNNDELKIGGKSLKIKMGKSKKIPSLILVLGVIVFFILGLMVGKTFFKQNVCLNPSQIKTPSKITHVNDGKNNTTTVGKYTFKIPTSYIYDKQDNGLIIYDNNASFRIYLKALAGSYEHIASSRVSIEESLKENEIDVASSKEIKINNTNYVVIEATTKHTNRLIAFTDAKNDQVFFIEAVSLDNKNDYQTLDIADDIIKNAEAKGTENEIEKIDINDISNICITAAEASQSLKK